MMQHQPDEHGNLMPKAQTKRLLTAKRILELEQEVSRLSSDNRDLTNKSTRQVLLDADVFDLSERYMQHPKQFNE